MYVVYLDESGDPNGWNNNQNHFILGGLAVHEGQIGRVSTLLDEIQAEFFPEISIPLKFHAVDLYNGRERFRNLTEPVRQELLDAIYDALGAIHYPQVNLFATAMHISAVADADQSLRATFEDVVQRVNAFLARLHRQGNPQKGMLIIDRSQSTESRYRTLIAQFRASGGNIGNIADIPYFSQSSETRLLQLADFCAYAVFRYYERSDASLLNKILSGFDRPSRDEPPDGLKHIIRPSIPCDCLACSWQ